MGNSIYGFYAQTAYRAKADIRRLKSKFRSFTHLGEPPADGAAGDWVPWLVNVSSADSTRNSAIAIHRRNGNHPQANNFENVRGQEVAQYNRAVTELKQNTLRLRELENTGEVFQSIGNTASEFRYIIDEEVQWYCCLEQNANANSSHTGVATHHCSTIFQGPTRIKLIGEQTDAVRIQCGRVTVKDLEIIDQRSYQGVGHRDAIQLIPPVLKQDGITIADRMAGSVMSDITVENCIVDAPDAELQGIFISDGFCRNVTLNSNQIETAAGHFISLAGMLDGCQIINNTLRQPQASDRIPQVRLYPGRLGGNMADDGNIFVLSFSANSTYQYAPVTQHGNRYIGKNQQPLTDQFSDDRTQIPQSKIKSSLGLKNFNYNEYLREYSQWRVSDFKAYDPVGFRRLHAWLEQRIKEYSTGKRLDKDVFADAILPNITDEQRDTILPKLRDALTLMQVESPEFLATRIADLLSQPIRSFMIKRISIRHGEITLTDVSADNLLRRTAQLKWFLPDTLPVDSDPMPGVVIPPQPALEKPLRAFGDLKDHIRVNHAQLQSGQPLTVSIDQAFVNQQRQGANLRYFWQVTGMSSGQNAKYEIDTTGLDPDEYLVRVTLHRYEFGTNRHEAFAGVAVVEVLGEPVHT